MAERPYGELRAVVERFGGAMEWVPSGTTYGAWRVEIGHWSRVFPSAGGSFPGLDELYIPIKELPSGYRDYSDDLIPGAMAVFASSVVGSGERSPHSWTAEEVECLVFCYFWMLDEETAGNSFNKAALYKELARHALTANARSAKAAERKCGNVSAILDEAGLPFVKGLVPDRHYQGLLRQRVLAELERRKLIVAEDFEPTEDRELFQKRVKILGQRSLGKPLGQKRPRKTTRGSTQYFRSPQVAAWVLQKAAGTCCFCTKAAPFSRPDGSPYLEVHHVIPLASGGRDIPDNAVALCPNCHRLLHHGKGAVALRERLYDSVEWLERP